MSQASLGKAALNNSVEVFTAESCQSPGLQVRDRQKLHPGKRIWVQHQHHLLLEKKTEAKKLE